MQLSPANTWTRFINLDRSVERRAQTEEALRIVEPVLGSAQRFAAIEHKEGWKGCTLSHLGVLEQAMKTAPPEIQHLAVFEDDIIWRPGMDVAAVLATPIQNRFDMLVLAYPPWHVELKHWQALAKDPHLMRLTGGDLAWTAGYIAHRRFWPILHKRWKETLHTLAVDVSWRHLLSSHLFLCYTPVLGNQAGVQSAINPDTVGFDRHIDPNIVLVGKSRLPLSPIDRLYPTVTSAEEAKEMFDYAIILSNRRVVQPSIVEDYIYLCKRRWIHGGSRCAYDFTSPDRFCNRQNWS